MDAVKIINLLHKGNEILNLEDMSCKERKETAEKLTCQAMELIGYVPERQKKKEKEQTRFE